MKNPPNNAHSLTNFLLYTTPNGAVKVEIFLQGETIWLTQEKIAVLFGVDRTVITKHLQNIYESGELSENGTCAIFAQVQKEGSREVKREIKYYNLDAILSVGYRVNSREATQFRIWANLVLKEYILKGFAMNDERLKDPNPIFGKDYFRELLERIRAIRTSERRIYQQITDIFAEGSRDYDPKSDITKDFYATIQNKFHFAITGKTGAEIIYEKSDSMKENMGLSTWKNSPNGRILKSDVIVAKNYLEEKEIKKLERTISSFFDYIENFIEQENNFTMQEFAKSVNEFLKFNRFNILEGKGNISHTLSEEKATTEYEKFNKIQRIESDFDREVKKYLSP
ncbi:MAG: virulence RhuM family protein [Candidatus Gracilibacteria bacterium]|nr:virulence RhuM family protein [Candidatus Gracilibacteria bacterium]